MLVTVGVKGTDLPAIRALVTIVKRLAHRDHGIGVRVSPAAVTEA